ncbi:hypothetical protein WJX81_006739 [Elliptochloris bilobata]|uniref:Tr-type G domain-containing protein n=1 Tax=Elliptochloris bilobata TaxID=381761 RepID=A0AAW1R293_9CHLO
MPTALHKSAWLSSKANEAKAEEILSSQVEEASSSEALAPDAVHHSPTLPVFDAARLAAEVLKRRNWAIISHPDAGKTTLTEKLLLYGGAIQEAGDVKARRSARHATSDWMEIEKERGISISSTALTFPYDGFQMNLLDTPGHQDFSEDTYRTLAAADNAVMLVDGAKGLEPQTRKLFEVVRMRQLPIFTFVNKMDRPALEPLEIIDQLEREFGLKSYPVNWPIGSGDRFVGVYHRPTKRVHLFERAARSARARGGTRSTEYALDDPALAELVEADLWAQTREEIELIEELGEELDMARLGEELDMARVRSGQLTPMFFGSAMSNFGVQLFLETFIGLASPPGAHRTRDERAVEPASEHFSGLVFKLQANMDARHRDKVAFIRVCSGRFEKGMKVRVARTGRTVALARPQRMFAQERETVLDGVAGDVIGLNNPGAFAIGDTLHTGPPLAFPAIPCFSPELFAYLRCTPGQKKAFLKGLEGLLGEGAVQVLHSTDDFQTDPILAAVGALQFEVVQARMKSEYGVDTTLDPLPYSLARWAMGGWEGVASAGRLFNALAARDQWGRPVLLFRNEYALSSLAPEAAAALGELAPYALPPDSVK